MPVFASGESLDRLFAPELLRGGHRKKYYRALSRLVALANEAESGREAAPRADAPPAHSPQADAHRSDTPQAHRPAPGASR